MARVADKVVIVTGAASGLGEATARALYAEGATVVIADINRSAGQQLAKTLGERSHFSELDVSSEPAWEELIASTVARFGRLDILVNNAGIVLMATIEDTTIEQLRHIQSINIDGPFLGCKHAIPAMAASGGGSIVNIASTASIVGTPPFAAYSATKGAVRAITQTVAAHCKQRQNGVRCNSVHPGAMATPMVAALAQMGESSPLALEMLGQLDSNEAVGEPTDVAAAVVYLASDEAKFVNGAQLTVDNGVTVT